MGKGDETRERILRQVARLFNEHGYAGATFSDIQRVTGLQKGGLYNHFENKEALALEAFDYATDVVKKQIASALTGKKHAADKLIAVFSVFHDLSRNKILPGGCPIMNTAIEADDAHPALLKKAREGMDRLRALFERIITEGLERQELCSGLPPEVVATNIIATMEGALMLSRLYHDDIHMQRAIQFLTGYINDQLRC